MSPLTLYLYLKPLYSNLGGSTDLAEAFTNDPTLALVFLKPWYRWKVFTQFTFVLSVTKSQDSFNITYNNKRASENCTHVRSVMSRLKDYLEARLFKTVKL